ncbi:MAG: imidazole glycerol phosphate synthase cyclase subunit [Victivallaceae bacterium]|nr:imidazole glycerol phosphate synthase cyclase subunit [Victivallaceae bacterium]
MQKHCVKIMPCLDMREGRVVKGVKFVNIADAGDPVECAKAYCAAGADCLALLDITATVEKRRTLVEVVKKVADVCTVPFTVGGGIADMECAEAVLAAGADKISISSAAYRDPDFIGALIEKYGADRIVLAIDVDVNGDLPSGYEVYVDGGRTATGCDVSDFAVRMLKRGVRTILPTSRADDGTKTGYDVKLLRELRRVCPDAELIASGGAGSMEDFLEAAEAGADVLLAASVFHFHLIDIRELKDFLRKNGIDVR